MTNRIKGTVWLVTGLGVAGYGIGLSLLSTGLTFEAEPSHQAVAWLAGARILLGVLFLFAVACLKHFPADPRGMAWLVGVGLLARLAFLPSPPMLEDDYNRYLWDGAVAAHGINPYEHPPLAALEAPEDSSAETAMLRELAKGSGPVIERINHPHIITIYPPLAQVFFGLAHWITPWKILGWRLIVLAFDMATLILLIHLLRELKLPLAFAAIYWWNPLVVHELSSSAHMDGLVLPFVLGALWLSARGRMKGAAVCLALGAGFKLWPVVLLPLVLRPILREPRRMAVALGLFALILAAIFWPMSGPGIGQDSGMVNYARDWTNNDALYRITLSVCRAAAPLAGFPAGYGNCWARWMTGALFLVLLFFLARKPAEDLGGLFKKSLLALAGLFLISPTPFPWYCVWMIPFLACRPFLSLLSYAALLPLFQLTYRWPWLVWVEHLPVLILLIWEWKRGTLIWSSRRPPCKMHR